MRLGWLSKRRLRRDGYVHLRGVVPPARIAAALRMINRSLGEEGLPRERLREMRARTFCPELVAAPVGQGHAEAEKDGADDPPGPPLPVVGM